MELVADIHNHIAVKTYLYRGSILDGNISNGGVLRQIKDAIIPNPEINVVEFQTDVRKMQAGGLNCVIASHYIPEYGLLDELDDGYKFLIRTVLRGIAPDIFNQIEKSSWTHRTFEATIESIDTLEAKIAEARQSGYPISIPRDFHTFKSEIDSGRMVMLHSVEGAHQLGRGLGFDEYLDHLHEFSRRGVCYLTLGHFFDNDFVKPIEGLPPDIRKNFYGSKSKNWNHHRNDKVGLQHPKSRELIEEMLKIGMIIDLVHSGSQVRKEVYKINENRRPLVYSHTGVQALFNNKNHPTDKFHSVTDDDIKSIQECKGVIGIICFNYWLVGREEVNNSRLDFGLQYILDTIKHIYGVTGTYENIAIGTDFDGMTDPPDDIEHVGKFGQLGLFLQKNGIPNEAVKDIMGRNMMRVLENGWR